MGVKGWIGTGVGYGLIAQQTKCRSYDKERDSVYNRGQASINKEG